MLGRVVSGFRTWTWTIAAPALAASSADWAICAGVTGTAGLRPGVSADPVTAHEIMTLRCMLPPVHSAFRRSGSRFAAENASHQLHGVSGSTLCEGGGQ